jgi:hypothetical protein
MQDTDGVNFARPQRMLEGSEEMGNLSSIISLPDSPVGVLYWAPLGVDLGDLDDATVKEDYKPWEPENTEDDALRYHRSEMRKLEDLLLTYQECVCDKTPEVLDAIKTVRNSLFKLDGTKPWKL